MPDIILVDKRDNQIGAGEKMEVHKKGLLHRAFSVVIFNFQGQVLLQKRAQDKYHSGGLWTNTCCSHPAPGRHIKKEVQKRLAEEMGFSCPLEEVFTFHYKVKLGELTENEIDHVFKGIYDGEINPDPTEVEDVRWVNSGELKKDIAARPDQYTYWFKKIMDRLLEDM